MAIGKGDDLTKWEQLVIPRDPTLKTMWGESTVIVDGNQVLNIAPYGGEALALVSRSRDGCADLESDARGQPADGDL